MDYREALKTVQTPRKVKENFMVLTFGYDCKIVVPHKDGVIMLNALQNAEQITDSYSTQPKISNLARDRVSACPLSHEEYEHIKIAALLGISVAELHAAAAAETTPVLETTV